MLNYDMQCAYPGPGPVTVRFPPAEDVPRAIASAAVLVDGKPAVGIHVSGQIVSVALAPPPQVMCMVIGPGRLTIRFTPAAGLGNPSRPGTYTVTASRGAARFSAPLAIRLH